MTDLKAYIIPMQPIPKRLEKTLSQGVVTDEFPDSSEAQTVFKNWDHYADSVIRSNDGRVLVACNTVMPGVTPAMIDWWFGWHISSTEQYNLWHPQAHTYSKPKENREYLADDRAKYIGNVSYVNEYIGKSMKKLAIAFQNPEAFGLNDVYANGGTAICARTADRLLGSEGGGIVHLIIPTKGGCQMRSAFWLGEINSHWPLIGILLKPILNTRAIRKIIINDRMALDLLRHCAEEMNHLARILPQLYNQYHDSNGKE